MTTYLSGLYLWDMPSLPAVLGWELTAGRADRGFNQDTKEIIDDTGHPHVLIKRTERKNVINIRAQFPVGNLDDMGGLATAFSLRNTLMTLYLNKTELLIFDRDGGYYYQGIISELDADITSNQVYVGSHKKMVGFVMTVTEDGYWSDWADSTSTTEYPRS